ncbi:septum site-determining protein MinC [Clostridium formicaceticum]|uniref:Probable septum site-determining protein MinC n=1 Tax=Clostridium formicaceticum TaxID=1497 RepID=A0AAC9RL54_9CLOT|nr:septum site-determining protein MinC [Clostridium formicaceticum]AOY76854.1 septum site-determining protein MinC [Clostridium formicaceticum]ARE87333.1 Septum site-determining protein MinC [Clostridium formicaceticum]
MPEKNAIQFKGTKEGLFIHIKPNYDFETIRKHLIDKLEKTQFFFKGANIFEIKCDILTNEEKEELEDIMITRYKLNIVKNSDISRTSEVKEEVFQGITEGKTKFIQGTVRSGQIVDYDGNVVVIGDVNPGGQVIARGNIVVMGNLRGIAHAGSNGNMEACVAALYLDPAQLRIANVIARAPDGKYEKPKNPELARIKQNMVYIEPYLNK